MIQRTCLFVFFLFFTFVVKSQDINIGLFYNKNIKSFTLTAINGKYEIQHHEVVKSTLDEGEIAYVTIIGKYLQIRKHDELVGTFKSVDFIGDGRNNVFSIKLVTPLANEHFYEDDLKVKLKNEVLNMINEVDMEKYIAGVVESESGPTSELEYYKSQALLCRTYAYQNMNRHYQEGFNLCDGVHCQAYKNKSLFSKLIPRSVSLTQSLIIVDSAFIPIEATFHSNSGGQTVNSEDVWVSEKYYLRSINDPYSMESGNLNWTTSIDQMKWVSYLKEKKFDIPPTYSLDYFNFQQDNRKEFYKVGNDSIALKNIRAHFNLRSTFFSVKADSSKLILTGKGYGHGVGLSQEGGMEMAKQGKDFKEIINFYYKDVNIISFRELNKALNK